METNINPPGVSLLIEWIGVLVNSRKYGFKDEITKNFDSKIDFQIQTKLLSKRGP